MAYRDYPRNGGRNADQPIVHDSIGISASQRTPTRESSRREPNPGSNRSTVAQYVVDRSPRERRASVTLGEGISGEGSLPPIRDVLGEYLRPLRTRSAPATYPETHPVSPGPQSLFAKHDSRMEIRATSSTHPNFHEIRTGEPSRRHPCPECGSRFATPRSLEDHKRTHTGERPFECKFPGCAATFNVSSNLRRHERTHQRNNPHFFDHTDIDEDLYEDAFPQTPPLNYRRDNPPRSFR